MTNLWIVNHYAGLPDTTPATRTFDLGRQLVRMGHHVTVFACSFNHYSFTEERLKWYQLVARAEIEGVRFVWIRGVHYRKNDVWRLLNMLVFALLALVVGSRLKPRPDIVIGVTVHPLAPVSAFFISRLRGARFWLDITDIWPQSLIELGHLRADSLSAKAIAWLERFSLRKAKVVISVLPGIADYVRDQGLPDKPTAWVPNGIDAQRAPTLDLCEPSDGPTFTLTWAGGFAPAHALDTILEAAAILQAKPEPRIRFTLIGDGPQLERVKKRVGELGLTNVELTGFVPKAQLYQRLAQADGFLVTGRNLPVYRYGISYNKVFDYMLAGRPIIFAVNARNNPVAEAGAGLSVPAENAPALAQAILQLRDLPRSARQEMGQLARQFVLSQFDYSVIAARLAGLF